MSAPKSALHCAKCGKLNLTRRGQPHVCSQPKAVITLTVEGNRLNISCVFTPSSKTTGPMLPAHAAAMAMLQAYSDSRKEGA